MNAGKLIVFSAPSGSGKTTLVHHLLTDNLPLGYSISATSRLPRKGEVNGEDYYFITEQEFQQKIEEKAFEEFEEVYTGTYYGTYKSEIERLWSENKHVLFDIDVLGGLNIKHLFPDQTLALFVNPPSLNALEKRLRLRGTENEERIAQRMEKSTEEMTRAKDFDVILLNDNLALAKQEASRLVREFLNL